MVKHNKNKNKRSYLERTSGVTCAQFSHWLHCAGMSGTKAVVADVQLKGLISLSYTLYFTLHYMVTYNKCIQP